MVVISNTLCFANDGQTKTKPTKRWWYDCWKKNSTECSRLRCRNPISCTNERGQQRAKACTLYMSSRRRSFPPLENQITFARKPSQEFATMITTKPETIVLWNWTTPDWNWLNTNEHTQDICLTWGEWCVVVEPLLSFFWLFSDVLFGNAFFCSRWGALSLFDAVVKHMAEHNTFGLSLDMFGHEMDFWNTSVK